MILYAGTCCGMSAAAAAAAVMSIMNHKLVLSRTFSYREDLRESFCKLREGMFEKVSRQVRRTTRDTTVYNIP